MSLEMATTSIQNARAHIPRTTLARALSNKQQVFAYNALIGDASAALWQCRGSQHALSLFVHIFTN